MQSRQVICVAVLLVALCAAIKLPQPPAYWYIELAADVPTRGHLTLRKAAQTPFVCHDWMFEPQAAAAPKQWSTWTDLRRDANASLTIDVAEKVCKRQPLAYPLSVFAEPTLEWTKTDTAVPCEDKSSDKCDIYWNKKDDTNQYKAYYYSGTNTPFKLWVLHPNPITAGTTVQINMMVEVWKVTASDVLSLADLYAPAEGTVNCATLIKPLPDCAGQKSEAACKAMISNSCSWDSKTAACQNAWDAKTDGGDASSILPFALTALLALAALH
eukprot:m51a1_g1427 hypothetical protein (271) ;mRNA; f:70131-71292